MNRSSFVDDDWNVFDRALRKLRSRMVRRHLPHGDVVVLDLGCGRRPWFFDSLEGEEVSHETECWGIDGRNYFEGSVLPPTFHFVEGDLDSQLPFPDGTFDAVTALAVIEHLADPAAALREVIRTLKPGGVFLATTPSSYSRVPLDVLAFLKIIDRREIYDHKRYFSSSSLRKIAEEVGFAEICIKYFEGPFNLFVSGKKTSKP